MKFNDFEIIIRNLIHPIAVSSRSDLKRQSAGLPQNEMPVSKPVWLLGISLSALQHVDDAELAHRAARSHSAPRPYELCPG